HLRLADGALTAPFVDAPRAGAARPKPLGRKATLLPVIPLDHHPAVGRDGDVGGDHLLNVRLDLVEESHVPACPLLTAAGPPPQAQGRISAMHRRDVPQRPLLPGRGASLRAGDAAPAVGA